MTSFSLHRRRWSGRLPLLVAAGVVINGVRLRHRIRHLAVLEPSTESVVAAHRFLTAAGVELDEATRRAASAHARRHRLDVVDLVPGDLGVERALDLARRVDPATYRGKPFARGRGALHALLAGADVLERAGITQVDGLGPVEMARATTRLKLYASISTDLAVAPGLRAVPEQVGKGRAVLQALYPFGHELVALLPGVQYAALAGGLLTRPRRWGTTSLTFCLQPYLVFAGSRRRPLTPSDLHGAALLRLVRGPMRWFGTMTGPAQHAGAEPSLAEKCDGLRPAYAADLAAGTERFFEPRRETCPWCGGGGLSVRLVTNDLLQRKPGRFVLEQCRACGHIFQNPRLSVEGLDFYYRDFYDGLGGPMTEQGLALQARTYRARATMLTPFTTPRSWLDLGTGHGHFCVAARDAWPQTVFDGLDMAESIEEAQRRGWVRRGYRGQFCDLADQLAGRYDVVSMFHYLEHTPEPFAELDAAAKVLPAGGHLLIELPNPESCFSRLLGRFWLGWLQPQHQHMIPIANLEQALADRGFTTMAVHRGEANQDGQDLTMAVVLALNSVTYDPRMPWLPLASRRVPAPLRRGAQYSLMVAALPAGVAARIADGLCHQVIRHSANGNAYRVLARKDS